MKTEIYWNNKKIEMDGCRAEKQLGTYADLEEFANDQYTEYGNRARPEKVVTVNEWFSSEVNDWYVVSDDSNRYWILVGNGIYAIFPKEEFALSDTIVIGDPEIIEEKD